eukprot:CAMPEP_0170514816 /NCGR_PEP_ID=MMETSP0209-20121228/1354_1 /TAXON_ID=665100 ORGANISM="Litonotus pictus, Strain P1" /NCGR_SAMPLE_ID=MMETSP0209 /ASSEMBLY_ACC=CAM_ASM_000301 /LENGTH=2243 /DNA_ID=CAMNT_0010799049 /DNA_START=1681 /DNA_END=8409 /DNA_ORIENTATION=-
MYYDLSKIIGFKDFFSLENMETISKNILEYSYSGCLSKVNNYVVLPQLKQYPNIEEIERKEYSAYLKTLLKDTIEKMIDIYLKSTFEEKNKITKLKREMEYFILENAVEDFLEQEKFEHELQAFFYSKLEEKKGINYILKYFHLLKDISGMNQWIEKTLEDTKPDIDINQLINNFLNAFMDENSNVMRFDEKNSTDIVKTIFEYLTKKSIQPDIEQMITDNKIETLFYHRVLFGIGLYKKDIETLGYYKQITNHLQEFSEKMFSKESLKAKTYLTIGGLEEGRRNVFFKTLNYNTICSLESKKKSGLEELLTKAQEELDSKIAKINSMNNNKDVLCCLQKNYGGVLASDLKINYDYDQSQPLCNLLDLTNKNEKIQEIYKFNELIKIKLFRNILDKDLKKRTPIDSIDNDSNLKPNSKEDGLNRLSLDSFLEYFRISLATFFSRITSVLEEENKKNLSLKKIREEIFEIIPTEEELKIAQRIGNIHENKIEELNLICRIMNDLPSIKRYLTSLSKLQQIIAFYNDDKELNSNKPGNSNSNSSNDKSSDKVGTDYTQLLQAIENEDNKFQDVIDEAKKSNIIMNKGEGILGQEFIINSMSNAPELIYFILTILPEEINKMIDCFDNVSSVRKINLETIFPLAKIQDFFLKINLKAKDKKEIQDGKAKLVYEGSLEQFFKKELVKFNDNERKEFSLLIFNSTKYFSEIQQYYLDVINSDEHLNLKAKQIVLDSKLLIEVIQQEKQKDMNEEKQYFNVKLEYQFKKPKAKVDLKAKEKVSIEVAQSEIKENKNNKADEIEVPPQNLNQMVVMDNSDQTNPPVMSSNNKVDKEEVKPKEIQKEEEWEIRTLTLDELREMRDSLKIKTNFRFDKQNLKEQESIKQMNFFISLVEMIDNISSSYFNLTLNGYPIEEKSIQISVANEFKEVVSLQKAIELKSEDWSDQVEGLFSKYYHLTYFYGPTYWVLLKYLNNSNDISQEDSIILSNLLKSLHSNITIEEAFQIYNGLGYREKQADPLENISMLGEFLRKIMEKKRKEESHCPAISQIKDRSLSLRRTFKDLISPRASQLVESISSNKPIVYETCHKNEVYNRIISSGLILNSCLPETNCILNCTEHTEFNEIKTFLFRFLLYIDFNLKSNNIEEKSHIAIEEESKKMLLDGKIQKKIFFILKPEKLTFKNISFLISFLSSHLSEMFPEALLWIISCDSKNSLFNTLKLNLSNLSHQVQATEQLNLPEIIQILDQQELIKVNIVISDFSGAGKSTYIRNKMDYSNQENYILLNIMDEAPLEKTIKRLQTKYSSEKRQSGQSLIHLNIGGLLKEFGDLNYFLFNLIFLKNIRHNDTVACIEQEDSIYIELANCVSDFEEKLFVLNLINKRTPLKSNDILNSFLRQPLNNTIGCITQDQAALVGKFLFKTSDGSINSEKVESVSLIDYYDNFGKDCLLNIFNTYLIKNEEHINIRQLLLMLKLLDYQFTKLDQNIHFDPTNLIGLTIRSDLIKCLCYSVRQFTSQSSFSSRKKQNANMMRSNNRASFNPENIASIINNAHSINNNYFNKSSMSMMNESIDLSHNPNIDLEKEFNFNYEDNIISWERINQVIIIFFQNNSGICPIIKDHNTADKSLKQLIKAYEKNYFENKENVLSNNSSSKLIQRLAQIMRTDNLVIENPNNYVMTADNFIKMLLISLRANSGVPIIIQGETGCGKTSLVKFLVEQILKEEMVVFNFHAGVTDTMIKERFLSNYKILADGLNDENLRLWIFLDEINTCNHVGLLSEIMCERSVDGVPLPDNVICVAACNPFRLKTDTKLSKINNENTIVEKAADINKQFLVYSVNPLTDSMLDFVWDFGFLKEKEEKMYIESMLISLEEPEKTMCINLVSESQKFTKENESKFAVSLRDVRRFMKLKTFLISFIKEKRAFPYAPSRHDDFRQPDREYNEFEFFDEKYDGIKSTVFSLLLCYYNRIETREKREAYLNRITSILSKTEWNYRKEQILKMYQEEQMDIANRMLIELGIATNVSLLENLFTLLICVLNKIPLFICGKPGCSKSLAVNLICYNLMGSESEDNFFKTLHKFFSLSYQGSENSTSIGIQNTFDKARELIKQKGKTPFVVFDEISLAAKSKSNPLKVLHALLEPEKEEDCIAFVGVSNIRLDASKMNRAVSLMRPDPTLEDLKHTAKTIYESKIKDIRKRYSELNIDQLDTFQDEDKHILDTVCETYFSYKNALDKIPDMYDFHGTRDFYSLVKNFV